MSISKQDSSQHASATTNRSGKSRLVRNHLFLPEQAIVETTQINDLNNSTGCFMRGIRAKLLLFKNTIELGLYRQQQIRLSFRQTYIQLEIIGDQCARRSKFEPGQFQYEQGQTRRKQRDRQKKLGAHQNVNGSMWLSQLALNGALDDFMPGIFVLNLREN